MPTRINDRYQLPDIGDSQLDAERQVVEVLLRLVSVFPSFDGKEMEIIAKWCGEFLRYARSRRVDDDLAIALHPPPICSKIDLEPGAITVGDIFGTVVNMEDRPTLKVEVAPEEPKRVEGEAPRLGIVARRLVTKEEFLKEIGLAMPDAGAGGACGCGAPEPHTPGGIHCRRK